MDPHDLVLSASSLTQLDRCARLFRYLYVDRLIQPTGAALETEEQVTRGKLLHRLIELSTRGPVTELLTTLEPTLRLWWQSFERSPHVHPQGRVLSELPLWVQYNGWRITARLDRVVILGDKVLIYDWKTEKKRTPDRYLAESWQIRLYPFLVHRCAEQLLGKTIPPGAIEMEVWFAQFPDQPYRMAYTTAQLRVDEAALAHRLQQLESLIQRDFPLTTDTTICERCLFRTRCYGLVPTQLDQDQLALYDWFSADADWVDPKDERL